MRKKVLKLVPVKICTFILVIFVNLLFLTNIRTESQTSTPISLEEAIKIALKNNKEIQEITNNLIINRAKVSEAKSSRWLNVSLQGSYRRTEKESVFESAAFTNYALVMPIDPLTGNPSPPPVAVPTLPPQMMKMTVGEKEQEYLNLIASIPLWTFGKIEGNIRISKLSYQQENINLDKVKLKVIYETKSSYYNYLLAEEMVKVREETLKQAKAHYNAAKKRYEVGVAPRFEVIRAEVEVAQAQENKTSAIKALNLARMAFNNTLGLPLEKETKIIKPSMLKKNELSKEECLEIAFKNRPELKQLPLAIEQAKIGARISRLRPTLVLQGNYGFRSRGSAFAVEDAWTGTIAIDFPLFDSGSARAKVNQAKATAKKLQVSLERMKDGIRLQVEEAYLSLVEAKERIITSEAILKQTEEALYIAERGYEEGVSSHLELIDAQTALTSAKLNYARAIFDYQTALAKLSFVCGVKELKEE